MKYALNILLLFTLFQSSAQNLVPNPSFEDTISCPTNGWLSNVANWESFSSSPDYYNSCVPNFYGWSVPDNYAGHQTAATGEAYIGAISYEENEQNFAVDREIIGCQLLMPLTIGQTYYVSFKVCHAPFTLDVGSNTAINKLGVLFSTVQYTNVDSTTIPPINNFAHVYTNNIITDTSTWTIVSEMFVADSAYTYMAIGNFFESINNDTLHTGPAYWIYSAYYLYDDICVSTDSANCFINVGLDELSKQNKELIRVVDTMGRETEDKPNTLLIYIYSDGTTEKVYQVK